MDLKTLLSNLSNCLETLSSKARQIDLDALREVLTHARDMLLDGINQPNAADQLLTGQKELAEAKARISSLESTNSTVSNSLTALTPFFSVLKNQLCGRVRLTYSDPSTVQNLIDAISRLDVADAQKFLDLKLSIDKDFDFKFSGQTDKIQIQKGEQINLSKFRISGGN